MEDTVKKLISDTRRWIEQERVWDDQLVASQSSPRPSPLQGEGHRQSSGKAAALQALYEKYNTCTRCALGNSRIKFVFGVGNPDSQVLFIGEGPGYEEDRRGEPFVGKAGQLLDKMMAAIGLSRQTAYIANIVKCHPMVNPQAPELRGNDRPPTPQEVETCTPILQQQIAIIQPKIIVTLGSPSTKALLQTSEGITKVRGRFFPFPAAYMTYFKPAESADLFQSGSPAKESSVLTPEQAAAISQIRILPMYHPAALLRNPNLKPEAWEDMKLLRDTLR